MNSYLYLKNNTYYELEKYLDIFEIESKIINKAKCLLLNNNELNDFDVGGYFINVYKSDNYYDLYTDNIHLRVLVKDNMIVSFDLLRY